MNRKAIWIGAGVLFLLAVGSGYLPDLLLQSELSKARQAGLMKPEETISVPQAYDARPRYVAAGKKYPDVQPSLRMDFAGAMKAPSAHLQKYLALVVEASALPQCSRLDPAVDNAELGTSFRAVSPPTPDSSQSSNLIFAVKALTFGATNESGLLPAARIVGHLNLQHTVEGSGYWALAVNLVLDKAAKLGLSPEAQGRLRVLLGSALDPREILRGRVTEDIRSIELDAKTNGRRVSRAKEETAYLRFWRGFFEANPAGPKFSEAVRRSEKQIEDSQRVSEDGLDLNEFTIGTTDPWASWAQGVEKADRRLGK